MLQCPIVSDIINIDIKTFSCEILDLFQMCIFKIIDSNNFYQHAIRDIDIVKVSAFENVKRRRQTGNH